MNSFVFFRRGVRRLLVVSLFTLTPAVLLAQAGDPDQGEVSVFGGGSWGLGTHPVVGGSSGFALARYAMFLFEGSYTPTSDEIVWRRPGIQSPRDSRLFDFNSTLQFRVPIRERWAPYAIVGGGLLYNTFNSLSPNGSYVGVDDFKFGFQTGGGLRYYIGENWGVRPEFRVIVSSRTFTRATVGIFWVVPSLMR